MDFVMFYTEAIMDIKAEHDAKKNVNEALIEDLIVMSEKLVEER